MAVCGCLGVNAQTQDGRAQVDQTSQLSANEANKLDLSALRSQFNEYDSFFLEAMVQRQKGNNDAAFDLLRHCIEINPQASEAYYYLSQYYSLLKDNDKAMEMVRRAAELSPEEVTYQETLMDAYINRRDYTEAAAVAEAIYKRHKDREDILELLFRLYNQQQDYENAIDILNRLEAINGKSERLSYAKSEIYSRKGDKEAAIVEMKGLADRYPNDMNYLAMYGDMLMMNNETEKALDIYHRILSEEPRNIRAQVSMLNYYREAGDSTAAEITLERLLLNPDVQTEQKISLMRQEIMQSEELGGDSTRVLALFAKMLAQPQEDADIATLCAAYMGLKEMPRDSIARVLHQVLDIEPDNAAARLQLVSYAWNDDDNDRVISLCQEAREYNPEEMAFYYYQGMAYYKKNDKDHALSTFQNGIGVINDDSNPDIVSDFYAVMGDLLHQKGKAREAFEAYDSCLQWKDDNIMCLNNYAYYLSERGEQLEKAEQMSYRTLKAEPKNATYLDTYAWILFMQKRYAEAKVYIEQALQNDSDRSAVITEHAGDIYIMNKDPERALELWRQAQQSDAGNKILARKIKLKKYIKQ
jgi:tetratricopeptide (TPR) repeat protein